MPTKSIHDRASEKSRAELLTEIARLPRSAFITTTQAAAYIGSAPGVMLNWRSQRRGPRYYGKNDFVRYRISDLDLWMSSRADEVSDAAAPKSGMSGCSHQSELGGEQNTVTTDASETRARAKAGGGNEYAN
jgi:hypothetical protein